MPGTFVTMRWNPTYYRSIDRSVGSVGGIIVSVDWFGLLAPRIALASTIMIAAVAAVAYVRYVRHRREE